MKIPAPQRPSLSGYIDATKLLPWSWVDARMGPSRNYWVATRTDGYPSSRPVWGLWRDAHLYFSSGSAIARNLGRDVRVQVNLESADEVVIIQGEVQPLGSDDLDFWVQSYKQKYSWDIARSTESVFVVAPRRVLAWMSDPSGNDGGALFANSATEWRF